MKPVRAEIERLTPLLRQFARALVEGARTDLSDELVHDTLADALHAGEDIAVQEVRGRVYGRLLTANRLRLRSLVGERYSAAPSMRGEAGGASQAVGPDKPRDARRGLDVLALADREALLLVVLAGFDYQAAAVVLAVPLETLVTRLVRARDALGPALWADQPLRRAAGTVSRGPRPAASHLRLVKSS